MTFLGLVLPVLIELFGPSPKIVVSEETTVITSPLATDGLPDYQQYWLNYGRKGVTFENNAAVPFWQAIWPGELSQKYWSPMSQALGFERIPSPTNSLRDPYSQVIRETLGFWLTEQYQQDLPTEQADALLNPTNHAKIVDETADKVIDRAMSRPWKSEQLPPLVDWITKSEEAFDLLHEAARRPKWWSPSPSLLGEPYRGAIYILLPGVQSLRGASRALSIRAMWHVGEGRPTEAWEDLQASFKLARLCGKGVTLVEQLVAIAMDGITCQRVVALLHHSDPDAQFARGVLNEINSLEVPSDVTRAIDKGDRVFFPDLVVSGIRGQTSVADIGIDAPSLINLEYLGYVKLDWNCVLREGTLWYDRLRDSMKRPTRMERAAALAKDKEDLIKLGSHVRNPRSLLPAIINSNSRSMLVADTFVSLMVSALDASTKAEDRARAWLDLTRTAAALAVYRAEHGEYPEKLEQLVPSVVANVPIDLYTGTPIVYERKSEGGYLLYSLFENGTDDGGTDPSGEIVAGEWFQGLPGSIPNSSSDLVIRVPCPEFELPPKPHFAQ